MARPGLCPAPAASVVRGTGPARALGWVLAVPGVGIRGAEQRGLQSAREAAGKSPVAARGSIVPAAGLEPAPSRPAAAPGSAAVGHACSPRPPHARLREGQ